MKKQIQNKFIANVLKAVKADLGLYHLKKELGIPVNDPVLEPIYETLNNNGGIRESIKYLNSKIKEYSR